MSQSATTPAESLPLSSSPPPRRLPGLLFLLPPQVRVYDYSEIVWKSTTCRRRRKPGDVECSASASHVCSLEEWMSHSHSDVVALWISPDNNETPYSRKLCRLLIDTCQQAGLPCLALMTPTTTIINQQESMFVGTGFAVGTLTAQMQILLSLHKSPSLTILYQGQKISSSYEELALEWNSIDHNQQQWFQGISALSAWQQTTAAAMFPPCTVL